VEEVTHAIKLKKEELYELKTGQQARDKQVEET